MCKRHRADPRGCPVLSILAAAGAKNDQALTEERCHSEGKSNPPRAALSPAVFARIYVNIYLIQVEKKALESDPQLSDASIKAPTEDPLKWIFEGIR